MKEYGAAKVITKAGPVWCHYSSQDDTRKLRRYSEGGIYEVAIEEGEEIEEFVPLKECKKLVPSSETYSYENDLLWATIFEKLEGQRTAVRKASEKLAAKLPIVVPITKLRRFYEICSLLDHATWENLAAFYKATSKSLERLWNQSREAFIGYRNTDDWGGGKRKTLPPAPQRVTAIACTNEFARFVESPTNSFWAKTSYALVERELNPRRTQRGFYSDKRPASSSGTGGIDLLFRSNVSGFPVVGEVKVAKDKNAFFALIQAMTYAVELSTPSQLARLKQHYGEHFSTLDPEKGKVEIALLMVNPGADSTRASVTEIVKTMNRRKKCIGLGKVTLIENKGDNWVCES